MERLFPIQHVRLIIEPNHLLFSLQCVKRLPHNCIWVQVTGAIQAVIDFLKKIFAFGDYIATSDKLKDFIRYTLKVAMP